MKRSALARSNALYTQHDCQSDLEGRPVLPTYLTACGRQGRLTVLQHNLERLPGLLVE